MLQKTNFNQKMKTNFIYYLIPKTLLILVIVLLLPFSNAMAARVNNFKQTIEISGKIVDENKQPVFGVSVSIKGTNQGVISDIDGNYKISLKQTSTLIFSFIGYKTQEFNVTESNALNVEMKPLSNALNEV